MYLLPVSCSAFSLYLLFFVTGWDTLWLFLVLFMFVWISLLYSLEPISDQNLWMVLCDVFFSKCDFWIGTTNYRGKVTIWACLEAPLPNIHIRNTVLVLCSLFLMIFCCYCYLVLRETEFISTSKHIETLNHLFDLDIINSSFTRGGGGQPYI